ncbi:HTTM domain-containing protein [Cryomorpha ignava]|uniref:HTTM domain-containing protein n=1 Tax=Cryomorpha ignava TaxID=101383 RepID=A0A7K3WRX0_9FLAO|nr:HTTM domain-containing protein [Cryomorpha ignava]NEN24413.1 HTTM domain-containing protein [Cryomorpha ignava]
MRKGFLFAPADIAPLAIFRILMGLLMAAEGFGAILTGWVRQNYVERDFTFNFMGFDFLQMLVGPQAYVLFALLGVFGLCIALGFRYKFAIIGFTILWACAYFGQKTSYNNHYYLLLLVCFLFILVPAHRYASADVKSGRVQQSQVTPYWTIWVFKFLLLIVYFYAAIAKIYPDWIEGKAVEIFLTGKKDWPLLGMVADKTWFFLLLSYGGIVFDLLVIPALWFKPTRKIAFVISIFFHLFNSVVFHIGIFPYMMLITSVLFFEPAFIRKMFFRNSIDISHLKVANYLNNKLVYSLLIPFFAGMILLPLRPFYFPGSSHWTEEGHRLSWHMMLRSKYGTIYYEVKRSDTGKTERINPEDRMWNKSARKLATRPDMAWQYAQRLKREYNDIGVEVEVYAFANASLNGRELKPLIDSKTDLAAVKWRTFSHNEWILLHPDL